MHLFGHIFDHDDPFRIPGEGERGTPLNYSMLISHIAISGLSRVRIEFSKLLVTPFLPQHP
jgi:hypothetical protein